MGDLVLVAESLPLRMITPPNHDTPLVLSGERTRPLSSCRTQVQIASLLLFVHKISRNVSGGTRDVMGFVDGVVWLPWHRRHCGGLSHSPFMCTDLSLPTCERVCMGVCAQVCAHGFSPPQLTEEHTDLLLLSRL